MHLRCWFARKMSQFTHFCGVKFLAWKSGCVKFWTNFMSALVSDSLMIRLVQQGGGRGPQSIRTNKESRPGAASHHPHQQLHRRFGFLSSSPLHSKHWNTDGTERRIFSIKKVISLARYGWGGSNLYCSTVCWIRAPKNITRPDTYTLHERTKMLY